MSSNNQDPMDVVNQFIDKNKDALSEISFGGGTELIVVELKSCDAMQFNSFVVQIFWSKREIFALLEALKFSFVFS
jgi:hypothetical protein